MPLSIAHTVGTDLPCQRGPAEGETCLVSDGAEAGQQGDL